MRAVLVVLLLLPSLASSLSPPWRPVKRTTTRPRSISATASEWSPSRPMAGVGPMRDSARTIGGAPVTALLLALWYAASVANNQTSKALVSTLGAETLTLAQFMVASACGAVVLRCGEPRHRPPLPGMLGFASRRALADTAKLAAVFLAGCYTLNACFAAMHVSLAMVLRAAEPLTTAALGAFLLPASQRPSPRRAF
ncbi:unnamed protein product, partial [Polarella glacialis]